MILKLRFSKIDQYANVRSVCVRACGGNTGMFFRSVRRACEVTSLHMLRLIKPENSELLILSRERGSPVPVCQLDQQIADFSGITSPPASPCIINTSLTPSSWFLRALSAVTYTGPDLWRPETADTLDTACNSDVENRIRSAMYSCKQSLQPLHGKVPHVLLWAGSRTARGKIITGIPNTLNYCVTFTVHKVKYSLSITPTNALL